MPSGGNGLENGEEALKAYMFTLIFLDLLHINCLHAPISAVSEQICKNKRWGGATTPCNAVMIYELF
jgi:hypothetical protein